jgi:hypothetical protein
MPLVIYRCYHLQLFGLKGLCLLFPSASHALPYLSQPPMAVGEMVVEGLLWQPFLLLALQPLAAAAEGVLKSGGNLDVVAPAVLDN